MTGDTIDRLLSEAASSGSVPGVVALSADRNGTFYQGAFGACSKADGTPMALDTVFRIASMTKAVTGVAAMQCVERGQLSLDQAAGDIMPELAAPQVLDGFDADGKPRLRPARRNITLRQLLTHTAGFVYHVWNAELNRYVETTGVPTVLSGKLAALNMPLAFDPGERWEYGINIDWAGRMVEAVSGQDLDAYMREHIFTPLGMHDTGFMPDSGTDRAHRAGLCSQSGRIARTDPAATADETRILRRRRWVVSPPAPTIWHSCGCCWTVGPSTVRGSSKPETVALMAQNHIGDLNVQPLKSQSLTVSNDAEFFPGMTKKWGLSWLINTEDVPGRRSAGSLAWAGLFNTYYWLDPRKQVTGVLLTQVLPFADATVLRLLDDFETAVYRTAAESVSHA